MKKVVSFLYLFSVMSLATVSVGCGGGGGGGSGESASAAKTILRVSPAKIDTGDRTLVTSRISDIHKDGIILKFLFPEGLEYVTESSELTVGGKEVDTGPAFNGLTDDGVYLVFFLSKELFGKNAEGVLTFELEANAEVIGGEIAVDADVDDKLIDNETEFDVENPQFEAEDGTSVEVRSS